MKMTEQDKKEIAESLRQDWLEQKRKDNAGTLYKEDVREVYKKFKGQRYVLVMSKTERDFIRDCIALRYEEEITCPYKFKDKKLMNKYEKIIKRLDDLKLKTLKL